jgi:hypothetical protein
LVVDAGDVDHELLGERRTAAPRRGDRVVAHRSAVKLGPVTERARRDPHRSSTPGSTVPASASAGRNAKASSAR